MSLVWFWFSVILIWCRFQVFVFLLMPIWISSGFCPFLLFSFTAITIREGERGFETKIWVIFEVFTGQEKIRPNRFKRARSKWTQNITISDRNETQTSLYIRSKYSLRVKGRFCPLMNPVNPYRPSYYYKMV